MTSFKAPELSAPRFRKKTLGFLNRDTLKAFIIANPRYKDLDLETFKAIVKTYNTKLSEAVINNSEGLKLPESLGILFIASCEKPKKTNPDYKKSVESGLVVNHRNWDSDNHLCKIFYTNYGLEYRLRDRELWSFKASKDFRSRVSKAFSTNHSFYRLVDNKIRVSELFRNIRLERQTKSKIQQISDDYNEFNFD
jgi:hypothetical protein